MVLLQKFILRTSSWLGYHFLQQIRMQLKTVSGDNNFEYGNEPKCKFLFFGFFNPEKGRAF